MFNSIALGLGAALAWGGGDFCGGLASRRSGVTVTIVGSQIGGVLLLVALAVAYGEAAPSAADLGWAAAAGAVGGMGLLALYKGLASGRMGVVAPLSAIVSAALPVLVAAALEGLPSPLTLAGFALALLGVWLLSRPDLAGLRQTELGLPLFAGVCFGLFFVFLDRVSAGHVFWPPVISRLTSTVLVTSLALASRRRLTAPLNAWPLIILGGLLDAGGNAFFIRATQIGRLDIAAVLSSLYPAATAFLAWRLLRERIDRSQAVGLVAALAAIVMIAWP